MKKQLHKILLAAGVLSLQAGIAQTGRYFEEIFTSVNKESNIVYGTNFYFTPPITTNPAEPQQGPLPMDVYTPAGDTATKRPLAIYLHTGNFLPQFFNGGTGGSRSDSTNVEICNRFARRGFVAAAISYRLGWDPLNSSADVRRGSLLNAVYRAIHDAQTAVRYFKKSVAENGNPYGVDTNRIVLFGQGSGGYISLAYNSLDSIEELQIEKFVDQLREDGGNIARIKTLSKVFNLALKEAEPEDLQNFYKLLRQLASKKLATIENTPVQPEQ
jgi:predicted peptidase